MRTISRSLTLLAPVLALLVVAGSARSANEGGVLLLHTDDTVSYTEADAVGFYAESGLACPGVYEYNPQVAICSDCEGHMLALNPTSGRGSAPVVWWALLAFPRDGTRDVRAVSLGHQWTGDLVVLDWGINAGMLDVPDPSWPYESGAGLGLAWRGSQTSRLTELYWMAGYVDEGEATLELIPHPGQGGGIADSRGRITPIQDYGRLGFGGEEGWNPTPFSETFGSCCLGSGECVLVTAEQCGELAGDFTVSACDPDPCTPSAAVFAVEEMSPVMDIDLKAETEHLIRIRNDGTAPLQVRFSLDPGPLPSIDADFRGRVRYDLEVPYLRSLMGADVLMPRRWWVPQSSFDDHPNCDTMEERIMPWLRNGNGIVLTVDQSLDQALLGSLGIDGLEILSTFGGSEHTTDVADHPAMRGVHGLDLPERAVTIGGVGEGTTWEPLVRDSAGNVVLAATRFGLGRVILTTFRFEDALVNPLVRWLSGTDRGVFTHAQLVIPPGEIGETQLVLTPYLLFDGIFDLAVEVATNDPSQPTVRIPLQLDVHMGDDGLLISDGVVAMGEVTRLRAREASLEIVNQSIDDRSLVSVESSDPRISLTWSDEVLRPGDSTSLDLRFYSEEVGFFDAQIVTTSNIGFERHILVRGEVVEEPKLELSESAVVLHGVPGRDVYSGSLSIRNAATDPRAVLRYHIDSSPEESEADATSPGPCGLHRVVQPSDGSLAAGETVSIRVFASVDAGSRGTDCSIRLRTNDPSNEVVDIPLVFSGGAGRNDGAEAGTDGDGSIGSSPVTETAIRIRNGSPSRGTVSFALDIPDVSGTARLDVHDASGRRVWSSSALTGRGTHFAEWTGQSVDGSAAAGVYWAVLRTPSGTARQRIVLVR
ncbi:MAG: hypothetical protein KDA27_11525 [Candidatus Eisenbacteria bacterium]|uniref:FlgD Ig-like domain-containing protein n=1 Tax=Eiseniibacteriota bacterium TaxID=2212470 RepID=A0A956NC36_UNCEI|nr:hypothetical protein [Candidatus Eisenbacteria bacterium]MCB9465900.1 hypothetical protein [Candidatus Eisenbacteria bacterium]